MSASPAKSSPPAPVPPEAPWSAGIRGARANLVPGLILQLVALGLVIAYYQHAPTRETLGHLVTVRADWGAGFSMLTTGFFGGFLPFLYLKTHPATRAHYNWRQGAVITAFWTYKGFEIDLWYRVLAYLVGEGNSIGTVLTKTALDQLLYCPLFAVPLSVLVYAWCENGFNTSALLADIRAPRWYARNVLPMLISNLGIWIPAVCIIYALPTPLQLPLQNVVLCFFTLLMAHIARRQSTASAH